MLRVILFVGTVLLVLFALHWGLYRWLTWAFHLTERTRTWTRRLLGAAFALFWISRLGEYGLHLDILLPLAYLWMGFLSLGSLLLPLSLLPPWRRSRWWTGGTLTLWFLLFGLSLFQGLQKPLPRTFTLGPRRVQTTLCPTPALRVVQLSDLHFQSTKSLASLRQVIHDVQQVSPDVVAITGDLYDGTVHQDPAFISTLSGLRARRGVFLVPGNHEYYHGISHLRELARRTGFHLLVNQARHLEGPFWIAGLDDEQGRHGPEGHAGPDLDRALATVPHDARVIVLRHRPLEAERASARGVVLQLSGHTHAGQYPPMSWLVSLTYTYPWGLYRVGQMVQYTSCGTGTWGPPLRLGSRSEWAVFDLPLKPGSGAPSPLKARERSSPR